MLLNVVFKVLPESIWVVNIPIYIWQSDIQIKIEISLHIILKIPWSIQFGLVFIIAKGKFSASINYNKLWSLIPTCTTPDCEMFSGLVTSATSKRDDVLSVIRVGWSIICVSWNTFAISLNLFVWLFKLSRKTSQLKSPTIICSLCTLSKTH
jgi:hypothetical protein